MHHKLKAQVRKDFPSLFPPGSERVEMAIGDGWFDILHAACRKLSKVSPDLHIIQIKEKFGDLTIYFGEWEAPKWWQFWRYFERNPWKIIMYASLHAEHVCEWCGQPGEKGSDGWIKVLCPEHRELWNAGKRWWLDDDGQHRRKDY